MDPITTAIIAALAAGAAGGVKDIAKKAMVDGYNGLKALIARKVGSNHEVTSAIEQLQAKPDSEGRRTMLAEEVKSAGLANDDEIVKAAQSLLERIKTVPQGDQHIQDARNAIGVAQADRGSTATVTFGGPPPAKKE